MKFGEAISKIDELKPNSYTQEIKIQWLEEIEGLIQENILKNYEGVIPFSGGCTGPDMDELQRTLVVQQPFSDLYIKWLEQKIDYANGEIGRYNNSMTAFNDRYRDFKRWYNKHHTPKSAHITYY